jgi:formate dehydrogenase assembly factor FdhD
MIKSKKVIRVINTQRDKITINCPQHGLFEQKLSNHLSGSACKSCGIHSMANKNKSTKEEFVEKAKKIHGSKYDYTEVDYKNVHIHVKIKCVAHNIFFMQSPRNHLFGYGCVHCGNEKKTTK